jgi:DNA-directed RNA polymerase specialized sigma24 family protein
MERPIARYHDRTRGRSRRLSETFLRAFHATANFQDKRIFVVVIESREPLPRLDEKGAVSRRQKSEEVDLMDLAAEARPSGQSRSGGAQGHDGAGRGVMARSPGTTRRSSKEYPASPFEIADVVGCPLSTVKTRLYQGLTVLRRELAKSAGRVA